MSEDQLSGKWPATELPSTWTWVNFSDFWVDHTDSKKKIPQKLYLPEGRFAVVDQGEALIGGYTNDERLLSGAPVPAVVFGDHTRAAKLIDVPFAQGADGVRVLSVPSQIDVKYAYEALRAVDLPNKGYSRHFKFLKATQFPLAPLPEQKRIVAKLDALSARSARARKDLARIDILVTRYKQAVLSRAFSGELTKDWRVSHETTSVEVSVAQLHDKIDKPVRRKKVADVAPGGLPTLPKHWVWMPVEDLASNEPRSIQSGPFGSALKHSEFVDRGVLVVGIDNVQDGEFSPGRNNRISIQKFNELSKFEARPGDVCITVMATIGRCCVLPDDLERSIITKHVYRISTERKLAEPFFLMNAFRGCPSVLEQMGANIRGHTRPGLNGTIIKSLYVPIAPFEEQQEIVRRIESAFQKIDRLAAEARRALELTDKLDEAILAKAFRGELVPQDPNDEPASVLLERTRAERAAAPKAKRGRRKS